MSPPDICVRTHLATFIPSSDVPTKRTRQLDAGSFVDFVLAHSFAVTSSICSFHLICSLSFYPLALFSLERQSSASHIPFYEPRLFYAFLTFSGLSLSRFSLSRRYLAVLMQPSRNMMPSSSRSSAVKILCCQQETMPG